MRPYLHYVSLKLLKLIRYKKVLLRERNWHTARRVASTPLLSYRGGTMVGGGGGAMLSHVFETLAKRICFLVSEKWL